MSHSGGLCSYGLLLLGDLEGPGSLEGENMAKMNASTGDMVSYDFNERSATKRESLSL